MRLPRMISVTLLAILGHWFFAGSLLAISEENYKQVYEEKVWPFFVSQGTEGTIVTEDQVKLAYKTVIHPDPIATLVILQGWTEHYTSYAEFAYDMYQERVSTYILDWRGQGKSQRFLEDTQKSYIDTYDSYQRDLNAFMKQVVLPQAQTPPIALAFSMGANVLSLYESQNPKTFSRIILVSPMLDIKSDPFPQRFAWSVAKLMQLFGLGDGFVWGHGHYTGTGPNIVTSSEARFLKIRELRKSQMDTVIGGATWSWLKASLEATWTMRDQADRLQVPMLMLQAGKDNVVRTEGQDKVCADAPLCLKVVFPLAMHAILAENDRIRTKALREIMDFIRYGY